MKGSSNLKGGFPKKLVFSKKAAVFKKKSLQKVPYNGGSKKSL